jgi:hypothetical protein
MIAIISSREAENLRISGGLKNGTILQSATEGVDMLRVSN